MKEQRAKRKRNDEKWLTTRGLRVLLYGYIEVRRHGALGQGLGVVINLRSAQPDVRVSENDALLLMTPAAATRLNPYLAAQ